MISVFTCISGLVTTTTMRTPTELGVEVISIDAASPRRSSIDSVGGSDTSRYLQTPSELHVGEAREGLRCQTRKSLPSTSPLLLALATTVTRSIWFGPRVTKPVSAANLFGRAAFAAASDFINETAAMLKASAIENIILRFMYFRLFNF